MAAIFRDSFDHYNDLALKWTSVPGSDCGIDLGGANSRTGIGCLALSGGYGPRFGLVLRAQYFIGCGYYCTGLVAGQPLYLFFTLSQLAIAISPDGTLDVRNNSGVFGSTGPGVVAANVYNYFELSAPGIGAGFVTVRLNGVTVIGPIAYDVGTQQVESLTSGGPGGFGTTNYVDDLYVNDGTGARNNGFLGPVRIGALLPASDAAPLGWVPSVAGPHYPLINQVPENGGVSWVESATVGAVDQYHFALPSDVPMGAIITDAQISFLAEVDSAGARSIGVSVNNGAASPGQALSSNYHYVITPFDANPASSAPWQTTDFPTTGIGPVVTA